MCNNYGVKVSWSQYLDAFTQIGLDLVAPDGAPNLEPQENIWPTEVAPIIRASPGGGAELVRMRWGFQPLRPKAGPIINFRTEGRRFTHGRCLAPASHFFEFTGTRSPKSKWKFTSKHDEWFCIAAIYRQSAGDYPESYSLLTLEPGPDVAKLHQRQIAILERSQWRDWLDPRVPSESLLAPSPEGSLALERIR